MSKSSILQPYIPQFGGSCVIRVENWEWTKRRFGFDYEFWTTVDPCGKVWLVKFKGSFYSYREWVFTRLASAMGLNVRAARLAHIASHDLSQIGKEKCGPFQLLLELIEAHVNGRCSLDCSYPELMRGLDEENDISEHALTTPVNAVDIILVDFLADIFGANEPSEVLFGSDHRFYVIDNEQMFCTKPSGSISAPWLHDRRGNRSETGHKLLRELCHKIVSFSDEDLRDLTRHPPDYKVDMVWDILPILRAGKKVARSILKYGPTSYYP